MPNLCACARNVRGSTDGRVEFGASLPFGPVTPHATCSSGRGPRKSERTPAMTALQIFAYWNALSTRHLRPIFLYCGVSHSGLFGSFQAVQRFTFGSGELPIPSDAFCCQVGGIHRPLYRSAAAYAKFWRSV